MALLNAFFPRAVALRLFLADEIPPSEDQAQEEKEEEDGGARPGLRDRNRAEDERVIAAVERQVLGVFDDAYMNKGLVYAVLERVLAAVVPELSAAGAATAAAAAAGPAAPDEDGEGKGKGRGIVAGLLKERGVVL